MAINVYEDYEGVLAMAIRLRRDNRCPRDIDDVYGQIISGIVRMAAILLPQEDPRYEIHRKDFLSEEVQSMMLCQCLCAAEKYVDTSTTHQRIVNYLVKTVQNRLRNYVRDTEKRKAKVTIVSECDLDCPAESMGERVMSLDGRVLYREATGKVNTREIEN